MDETYTKLVFSHLIVFICYNSPTRRAKTGARNPINKKIINAFKTP